MIVLRGDQLARGRGLVGPSHGVRARRLDPSQTSGRCPFWPRSVPRWFGSARTRFLRWRSAFLPARVAAQRAHQRIRQSTSVAPSEPALDEYLQCAQRNASACSPALGGAASLFGGAEPVAISGAWPVALRDRRQFCAPGYKMPCVTRTLRQVAELPSAKHADRY